MIDENCCCLVVGSSQSTVSNFYQSTVNLCGHIFACMNCDRFVWVAVIVTETEQDRTPDLLNYFCFIYPCNHLYVGEQYTVRNCRTYKYIMSFKGRLILCSKFHGGVFVLLGTHLFSNCFIFYKRALNTV